MHLLISLLCSLLLGLVATRPSAERHIHEDHVLEKRVERTHTIWQEVIVTKTIYAPWPSHHGHLGVENHREAAHFVPGTGTVAPSLTPVPLTPVSSTCSVGSDEEQHQTSKTPLAISLQTGHSLQGGDLSQPTSTETPWASLKLSDSKDKATVAMPTHTAQSAEVAGFSQPSSSETLSASSVRVVYSQAKGAKGSQSSNPTSALSPAAQSAPSSTTSSVTPKHGKYPFSGLVAFGDNVSLPCLIHRHPAANHQRPNYFSAWLLGFRQEGDHTWARADFSSSPTTGMVATPTMLLITIIQKTRCTGLAPGQTRRWPSAI